MDCGSPQRRQWSSTASTGRAFASAQIKLSVAGVRISDIPLREMPERINSKGGFGAAESYAFHRPIIAIERLVTRI
jgi:hypothetical protein